jgi:hypothetical protein
MVREDSAPERPSDAKGNLRVRALGGGAVGGVCISLNGLPNELLGLEGSVRFAEAGMLGRRWEQ